MPASGRFADLFSRHAGLVAAVVLAVSCQLWTAWRAPIIALDGITFVEMAQALDQDPIEALRTFDQHPGYPALMGAAARVGNWVFGTSGDGAYAWAGHVVSGICGLACVVLVWLITRHTFDDDRLAGLAAVLFAVVPLIRQNAADALSDTPHLAFYLLAAWCICRGFSSARWTWFVAGGVASGLAFWIRPEGLSVALVAAVLLTGWMIRPRGYRRRRLLGCLTAASVAACVVVTPYLVIAGKFTSKKQPAVVQQRPPTHQLPFINESPDESPAPAAAAVVASDVATNSADVSMRLGRAVVKYAEEVAFGYKYLLLIPLAGGHFLRGRMRPRSSAYLLLMAWSMFHTALLLWLHFSAGYIGHRHVIPLVAMGMPFVASGTMAMIALASRWLGERWRWLAPATAVALVALFLLPRAMRPPNYASQPVVAAAAWINQHREAGSRVLANSRYVGFYADMPSALLGVEVPDLKTALAPRVDGPGFDFVVLEVDARRFQPPGQGLRGHGYVAVTKFDGGDARPWQRVIVYQLESKIARDNSAKRLATQTKRDVAY